VSSDRDLTARARIRDAAITLFAEKGIAAATIRDIAAEAGVSSGLLRHHFGSKEGLRDACDDYAIGELMRIKAPYVEGKGASDDYMFAAIQAAPLRLQSYIVRSSMDGSPTGEKLFDRMIEQAEQWVRNNPLLTTEDPAAYSAVLLSMTLGMYSMRDQISRVIGQDTRRPAGQARMILACLDILTQPMIDTGMADQARKALARLAETEESS
jgi:TetR/AcrR family transcriptional regulator, regulator of cefoperazone and chloramphenicol sensitivity